MAGVGVASPAVVAGPSPRPWSVIVRLRRGSGTSSACGRGMAPLLCASQWWLQQPLLLSELWCTFAWCDASPVGLCSFVHACVCIHVQCGWAEERELRFLHSIQHPSSSSSSSSIALASQLSACSKLCSKTVVFACVAHGKLIEAEGGAPLGAHNLASEVCNLDHSQLVLQIYSPFICKPHP